MPSRTTTLSQSTTSDSDYLSSSLSGLSRSRSTNTLIVRAYKQATQLYLTRRFREAWEVLEPVVTPQKDARDSGVEVGGRGGEGEGEGSAPVAQSSRGTRTKVWVFYLSLVHAIVELGAEEGKGEFGAEGWRGIVRKAREGSVWDEVVVRGYAGNEGEVDAEIVVNLATLLLGHMPTQALNQRKLEAYLAASEDVGAVGYDGTSTPMSTHSASPKALQARLKILELYTLHVLPENGEWDYAREFLEANDSLDEERKEAFVQALDSLKEEKDGTAQRERELQAQREREAEEARKAAEVEALAARRRAEDERKKAAEAEQSRSRSQQHEKRAANSARSSPEQPAGEGTGTQAKPPSSARSAASTSASANANGQTRQPSRPANRKTPAGAAGSASANFNPNTTAANMFARLGAMLSALRNQNFSYTSSAEVGRAAAALLNTRLVMFLLAFILLATRRDLRIRLRRALADGWAKVRRTIGAGVKVSYV